MPFREVRCTKLDMSLTGLARTSCALGTGHLRSNDTINIEHQTSSIEHRTSNIEHQASNIRHLASNIEHRASNIKHRTSGT